MPARIGLLVRLRYGIEWVDGQPIRFDAPVAERHQCIAVGVPGPSRHVLRSALGEPALQGLAAEVNEGAETTFGCEAAQVAAGVLAMNLGDSLRPVMFVEGVEVPGQWRCLMVRNSGLELRSSHRPGPLGSALKVAEHAPGRLLIAATSRHHLNGPAAVAVFGDVARRLNHDTVAAILPFGQRRRPGFAIAILPTGETLALADERFSPGW